MDVHSRKNTVSFLFWNLNKKPLQKIVSKLSFYYDVDILMFAECSVPSHIMLMNLNKYNDPYFHYSPCIECKKILIFSRFNHRYLKPKLETDRLTIRHFKLPGMIDFLLAINHFPSKCHWKDSSQAFECANLSDSIRQMEEEVGHLRTILIGDLNMNPFEGGIISARGLHAIMDRNVARRRERTVQSTSYPFFYNPMWGLMGDISQGPPGTYYYEGSEHEVHFWNTFDQVLIRPDLIDLFNIKSLRIIEKCKDINLLKSNGTPDHKLFSDHLPIYFEMNLKTKNGGY